MLLKHSLESKQDFIDLMFQILDPLEPYYSKEKAFLKLGDTSAHYPDTSAWMEGFSRPLWALAPFFSGGGESAKFLKIYLKGLKNGTNPNAKEYWGTCHDYDQKLVEMAAIAYTLLLNKDWIFTSFTEQEKNRLMQWLEEINHNKCCDCNWRFFHILVNIAFQKCGHPYDKEGLKESLDFIDRCHTKDGWYKDGTNGDVDYYNPWAFEFYGLVYAYFMEEEDPARSKQFKERAKAFGKEYVYWFSKDGSAIPIGRSLTYRFAQSAFYAMCIVAKVYPLSMECMKGIIVRNLNYFCEKPIFDHSGIMTIGYAYPNLNMSESYNSPGSAYWAMKTFAILALDSEDAFFGCKAQALPKLSKIKHLNNADMIIQRRSNGNVIAFPGGTKNGHVHGHTEEKYAKFAYSTKFGFSVMRSCMSITEAAADNVLSFEVFGHIYTRNKTISYEIKENEIYSQWEPIEGIRVKTTIHLTKEGHVRTHEIESDYDCVAYDAGFAIPVEEKSGCEVFDVQKEGEEIILHPDPNTNLIASKTWIPVVKYQIKKGKQQIQTAVMYD